MNEKVEVTRIAILGGGPSALFMFKRLVESNHPNLEVTIFEKKNRLGVGMPYGTGGANREHITNVSDNEVPNFVSSIEEWSKMAPEQMLAEFKIDPDNFNEYKVLPRLFFGEYLAAQFDLLLALASDKDIVTHVKYNCSIADVVFLDDDIVKVIDEDGTSYLFNKVIMATGHSWPRKFESEIPNYFDSPYPPAKLKLKLNHEVAIKGASLTAIDAVRTLSRANGKYFYENGKLHYSLDDGSEDFRIVLHSISGLLPAVRFHLEDSRLKNDSLLSIDDIKAHKAENGGYVSLDFIFEKDFKEPFQEKNPSFYDWIKDMQLEDFVDAMMNMREKIEPFLLLGVEYDEAERSIRKHESIYWKEMLAILSFSMNYPAKYFSAEDMLRLKKKLMPLVSLVIAFVPQSSCEELLALHNAGILDLISVGADSEIETLVEGGVIYHYKNDDGETVAKKYNTFVDAVGQPHLEFEDFPFASLRNNGNISPALLKFKHQDKAKEVLDSGNKKVKQINGSYYLDVPGIAINDDFQVIDANGKESKNFFIMAVPYIGGFNPDYSGIDFSEEASQRIMNSLF
ncbi:FAD/NAD(P)-binding protein [Pedobacter namyangjuensis]|uniref:FAD/NAD(P)-binding protein n=1 Tax=Pedobacter namyangjuensis TaxID=600626 RepID=UPI000DE53946|nr:FAD/NAD(P)-binding protein [Pedobacter namyangjuensis]